MQSDSMKGRLAGLISEFSSKRLLVIGDLMLDEFIWGKVSRISPEAPVPIVNVTGESYYPGGAANVARNIREFTPHVSALGMVGADANGRRLLQLLQASGIDTAPIECNESVPTTVKTRIIARNQQVVRVDRERKSQLTRQQISRVLGLAESSIERCDAIVVADYGKGFLTQEMADHICESARRHGKTLTVDPHPHTSLQWRGATAIKPNRAEAFIAAGLPASDPVEPALKDEPLIEAGKALLRRWESRHLLITLGEQGMLLLAAGEEPYYTPTRAQEVFDVSGAGDTAISVFTLALASGADGRTAAELANCASGIVVGKLGTATVTASELQASCLQI
jgi:D-glycero-beta-D-manno-heptose-7-phosphate kinase